jgi:hypothetical protein
MTPWMNTVVNNCTGANPNTNWDKAEALVFFESKQFLQPQILFVFPFDVIYFYSSH